MSRARDLLSRAVDALYGADNVDDFVAVDKNVNVWHQQVLRMADAEHRSRRQVQNQYLELALYRDVEAGRGTTRMRIDDGQVMSDIRSWREFIDDGVARASVSLEPVWDLPKPAAPARVEVADPQLLRDPRAALTAAMSDIDAAFAERRVALGTANESALALREVRLLIHRELSRVRTSNDFAHDYWATLLDVEIAVAAGARVERVRRQVRRRADLQPAELVATAIARAGARVRARPIAAGRYDIILAADARTPSRVVTSSEGLNWKKDQQHGQLLGVGTTALTAYGWFAPLVAHADSRWARRGLTRYQPNQRLLGDRPIRGDALTLISDGTVPFGLRSRPVGDLGAPTRRFIIIDRGVARGLSLDLREAAVRARVANGGVGNLRVAAGTHSRKALATPGTRPLLRLDALDWLHIDTRSGAFVAALGVGSLLSSGDVTVTGGFLRGNVFDLWADARLSTETDNSGWYYGPSWLRFDNIEIS